MFFYPITFLIIFISYFTTIFKSFFYKIIPIIILIKSPTAI